jgi:hypothetical protein
MITYIKIDFRCFLFININMHGFTISMESSSVQFWRAQAVRRKEQSEMSKALALVAEAMRLDAEAKQLDALAEENYIFMQDPTKNAFQIADAIYSYKTLRSAADEIRGRYYLPCYN